MLRSYRTQLEDLMSRISLSLEKNKNKNKIKGSFYYCLDEKKRKLS